MNSKTHLCSSVPAWLVMVTTLILLDMVAFAQGSLTPPGAPAPMFKTLQQVEPRFPISVIPTNLTVSGSYYLTTNLTQTIDVDAITLSADDITIDLNGFALIGTNGLASGITHGGFIRKNIHIFNGTIRNWRQGLTMNGGGYDRIDRVRVHSNTENGILSVDIFAITDCYIADNGFNGLKAQSGRGLIRDCVLRGNGLDAIQVFGNTVIMGNWISGPSSVASTNAGIRALGSGNRIDGNHISFYGNGVVVSSTVNTIIRNVASLTATNFAITAGNLTGPTNTLATGLTGNPFANLSY